MCTSTDICISKTLLQSINSSELTEFLSVFQPHLLTMSVFTMAHLKVDASVEFSGDQSVGHNHHQPRDCKQHEQQQDVPEWDTLQVSVDFHCTPSNGVINRKKHSIHFRSIILMCNWSSAIPHLDTSHISNPNTSAVTLWNCSPPSTFLSKT